MGLYAFVHLAWFVVLPLLLLIGIGFLIQRKIGLDKATLIRLNFYLIVPGMIYSAVVSSPLKATDVVTVVGFSLLAMACWAGLSYSLAVLRRVPRNQRSAMLMTSIFYNSGNYGLPLQELAFRGQTLPPPPAGAAPTAAPAAPVNLGDVAMSLQVFVMVVQNFTSFTLGVFLAASGGDTRGRISQNLRHIARFPPVYALTAALLTILLRKLLGEANSSAAADFLTPFWDTLTYVKRGFVVIALVTLGAQLALVQRGEHAYPVKLAVLIRLVLAPLIGFSLIKLLGLDGLLAQVLLISTATPTSVNCMLLCMEFDNHPDFVARAVFYSTLLSPITATLVIMVAQSGAVG